MRKVLWLGLVVAALICMSVGGFAQAPADQNAQGAKGRHACAASRAGQYGFMRLVYLQKRLNLTAQQIDQIKEIHYGERLKAFDNATTAADEREALLKSIFDESANASEIKKRKAAVQQAQAASLNQFVATMQEVSKVLTPEQRTEFLKMLDEHSQKRAEHRAQVREKLTTQNPQTTQQ